MPIINTCWSNNFAMKTWLTKTRLNGLKLDWIPQRGMRLHPESGICNVVSSYLGRNGMKVLAAKMYGKLMQCIRQPPSIHPPPPYPSHPAICFHDALQAGRQATSTHSVLAFSICDKMPQQPPLSSTCTSSASPVTEAGCRSPSTTTTKLLPWADTSFVSFSTRTGWLVGRGCWVEFWWVSGTLHASHIKT